MRILLVNDAWFPHMGGGQVHAWELSKKLADLGVETTILTRNLGEWNETYKNVKVIRLGHVKQFSNLWSRVSYLFLALIYILRADYDILNLHSFSPGLLAPIVRLFKGKPIVFTVLGEGLDIAGLKVGADFLQDIVFYKILYDLEITVSKDIIKKPVSAKKLIMVSNGVNIERFKDSQRSRKSVNKILFVGRFFYDKGPDLMIDVFKGFTGKKLIMVGGGPLLESTKKQAYGLNVEFKGQLEGNEYLKVMKEADLLVMPSRTEGLPIRLLEAWSAKLPVVATDVGETSRYIKDGLNGFLVKVDSSSITQGINSAMSSNLEKIAQTAYRDVHQYSWTKIAQQMKDIYDNLLKQ